MTSAPPLRRGVRGALFLIPWTTDLYVIAAAQEKWVLAAGALNLWWFSRPSAGREPFWRFALGSALCLLVGFCTKAQFVVFIPALLLMLLIGCLYGVVSWVRLFFAMFVSGGAVLAVQWVAHHGSYTGKFGLSKHSRATSGNRTIWRSPLCAAGWAVAV